jgi:hypothetical protein
MTFKDYVRFRNPVSSQRAKYVIYRNNLKGNESDDYILSLYGVGKKTLKEIKTLYRKFKNKEYSR